ncbi:MAG: hypothetical protein H6678_14240 [Candidatus Delongbacteria bacterium]|nr:hypothetical protein [Candidatus Cloacimonadota bacterium]MCB9474955.1 hypothetical protein [Candidatus Delongbacteria bacterium]
MSMTANSRPHAAGTLLVLAGLLLATPLTSVLAATPPAGYTRAVELVGAGQYRAARTLLDSLIRTDALPTDLKDNGQFWLGECHYAQHAWLDAMLCYERCLAEPNANKAEVAQLRVALCWTNLGQEARGCREARRLLARWPRGEHTTQAQRLEQLACGKAGLAGGGN